jgi:hypothetical protein
MKREYAKLNGKARLSSREIVLNYLSDNCQGNPYKLKGWEKISDLIEDYLKNKGNITGEALEKLKSNTGEEVAEVLSNQIDLSIFDGR